MKLIALSGGIASGKSLIAARLAALGAVHIDADQLAREVVLPGTPALAAIRERFGSEVFTSAGSLDRGALAAIVFADRGALADLNAIVHPEVRRLAEERIAAARQANPAAIVIYDVPLLVEAGVGLPWDAVVIAEAPAEIRKRRLVQLRQMSSEEAERRVANQASDAERRQLADVIIDTSGSTQHTLAQTDSLWAALLAAEQGVDTSRSDAGEA